MGVIVAVRDSEECSLFKRFLYDIFEIFPTIDEVLICSGFYQEKLGFSRYEAVREKYKGLSLADLIHNTKKVTIVGIKDSNAKAEDTDWHKSYKAFVKDLRSDVGTSCGTEISAYYSKKGNWHAKIFIALSEKKIVAGIVGSSNFTSPAFGENNANGHHYFNVEADTILYDSCGETKMADKIEEVKKEGGNDKFLIVVPSNSNRPEDVRVLDDQYSKIMRMINNTNDYERF